MPSMLSRILGRLRGTRSRDARASSSRDGFVVRMGPRTARLVELLNDLSMSLHEYGARDLSSDVEACRPALEALDVRGVRQLNTLLNDDERARSIFEEGTRNASYQTGRFADRDAHLRSLLTETASLAAAIAADHKVEGPAVERERRKRTREAGEKRSAEGHRAREHAAKRAAFGLDDRWRASACKAAALLLLIPAVVLLAIVGRDHPAAATALSGAEMGRLSTGLFFLGASAFMWAVANAAARAAGADGAHPAYHFALSGIAVLSGVMCLVL